MYFFYLTLHWNVDTVLTSRISFKLLKYSSRKLAFVFALIR